ncbi:c-type cytochrome biogenesis protein CcsB [Dissulfurirhabdus thermomarina]|uniref:Heme exporter protein C n=1 Tax=Dissulfurirhabdus thermomarina TaxID=1765737 RepID=A0A6N9TLA0_DISTH|nr:c-type cytochrome biogenesis protein CcsB [Dissulfurirhabdus thermomarina]NDY42051.1 c-type cytochrome biogenesis protein CcsB [Dissulfurirhabdus thermomarina]
MRVLFQSALGLYLVATAAFLVHIVTLRKWAERWGTGLLAVGFAVHAAAIGVRWRVAGHPPVTNLHEALSFVGWAVVGAYLLVQWRQRVKALGAFVTPLAAVLMVASSLQPAAVPDLPPALRSYWLPVHATICLLGDAVFALAFCLAVMYLLQERQIKHKRLGGIFRRLPSLDVLDALNYRCLTLGFPLLTVGIVTGSIWAEQAWGSYWSWDPKETWSLITWLLYAALLHQRLTVGWRGRRAAIMTILGFGALFFTFLGVSVLLPGLHSYANWFE